MTRMRLASPLALSLLLAACFATIDLSNRSCPCAKGWACNEATQRCVPAADGGAQGPELVVLAGMPGGYGNLDGQGASDTAARFRGAHGLATDGSSLYIADRENHLLRKLALATGEVTTIAGRRNQLGAISGADATLNRPRGLWLDPAANILYFVQENSLRRTELSSGFTTLVAGGDSTGLVDGVGAAARFNTPTDVVSDGSGVLYVLDRGNHGIRAVTTAGVVTTIAGGMPGATDSPPLFNGPSGLALAGGNLYIADSGNSTLRQLRLSDGVVTTIAGTAGLTGWVDDFGAAARLYRPTGLCADGSGRVYFTDGDNHRVRALDLVDGRVTTIAGTGKSLVEDGIGTAAAFLAPERIVFVAPGALYVSDSEVVRKIDLVSKAVTTIAGLTSHPGKVDGPQAGSRLSAPFNLAHDAEGNVYAAEGGDYTTKAVRKLTAPGTAMAALSTIGNINKLNSIQAIAIDPKTRELFIVENHAIMRRDDATGTLSLLAGARDTCGGLDGVGDAARFCYPNAIAADGLGHLFVADTESQRLRQIDLGSRVVTSIAGSGSPGSKDGIGPAATFYYPRGMTLGEAGVLYISDDETSTIRKVVINTGDQDGVVSTIAGKANEKGSLDGIGAAARFSSPRQLAYDPVGGMLYIADSTNALIRRLELASGAVTTVAGVANQWGVRPGPLPALLNRVTGVDFVPGLGLVIACPADNVLLTVR